MSQSTVRPLTLAAAFCWLVVGGYGLWQVITEVPATTGRSPTIFAIALLLGSLLTLVAVWVVSRAGEHPLVRRLGLAVSALGVLSTVAAWALPVWMTLLVVGYVLIALSGTQSWRRPVAFLAVAQLLGVMTVFVGLTAELGPATSTATTRRRSVSVSSSPPPPP